MMHPALSPSRGPSPVTDRFPVTENLERVTSPVVVIRGDREAIVPTELSHGVAVAAPTLVDEVVLPGNHNDAIMFAGCVAEVVLRLAEGHDG
jgi:uncharacterized protein